MMNSARAGGTALLGLLLFAVPAAVVAQETVTTPPSHLSLEEAMVAARRDAPVAAAAAARTAAAEARVGQAKSELLPQLGATAGWVNRSENLHSLGFEFPTQPGQEPFPDLIGPFTVEDARVSARMTLFDLSDWARVDAAERSHAVAAGEESVTLADASLRAAEAYLSLSRADALVGARAADTLLARQVLAIAQAERDAGTGTGIDVTRGRVQLAAARTAYTNAVGAEDQARIALLRSIGAPLDRAIAVDTLGAASTAIADDADALAAQALRQRPELDVAGERVATADASLHATKLEQLPSLSITGNYGLNGPRFNDRELWTRYIAVQLSWSGWDGGRRLARVDEQTALRRAAEAMRRDTRLAVEADARQAASALRTARAAVGTSRERLALAGEELEQAEERYREGLAGSLDVITAQQGLSRARDALIDALYRLRQADVEARRATGTLVPQD